MDNAIRVLCHEGSPEVDARRSLPLGNCEGLRCRLGTRNTTSRYKVLEELYTPAQHRKQGERRETHIIDHLVHDRSVFYPQPQLEAVRSMQDDGQCNGSIYECEICGL
jgi:hypothetical protein